MSRYSAIKRAVVARKPWYSQLGLALAFVAVAAGGRWFLDRGANGVPFASFFPFLVISAILLDLRYAVLVALLSMFLSAALFLDWDGPTAARVFLVSTYFVTAGLLIAIGQTLRSVIVDLEETSQRYAMFNEELQHRFKNTLQTICAMASSGSRDVAPERFYADLSGRVQALNRANQFLGIANQKSGPLAEIVAIAIKPFRREAFRCEGPHCKIDGETAMQLMMALHELCTNALKYGALSQPGGKVVITWQIEPDGGVALTWREADGPPVEPPTRRGLGSRLLVAHGPLEAVSVDYRKDGVRCALSFRAAIPEKVDA